MLCEFLGRTVSALSRRAIPFSVAIHISCVLRNQLCSEIQLCIPCSLFHYTPNFLKKMLKIGERTCDKSPLTLVRSSGRVAARPPPRAHRCFPCNFTYFPIFPHLSQMGSRACRHVLSLVGENLCVCICKLLSMSIHELSVLLACMDF